MKNTVAVEKHPVDMAADDDDIQFNILHTEYHDSNTTDTKETKETKETVSPKSTSVQPADRTSDQYLEVEQNLNNKSAKKVSFSSPSTEDSTIITKSGGSTKKVKSKGEKSSKAKTKSLKIKSSKSKSKHKRKPKVKVHVSFSSSDDSDSDNDSNASNSEVDDNTSNISNRKEKIKSSKHKTKHTSDNTARTKQIKTSNEDTTMSETGSDSIDITSIVQVDDDVMKLASQHNTQHKSQHNPEHNSEPDQNSDADDSLVDVSHDNNIDENPNNTNKPHITGGHEELPYISSDEVEEFYGKGVDDKSILQEYFNTI